MASTRAAERSSAGDVLHGRRFMDVPSENTAAGSRRADEGESVAAVVRLGGQWRDAVRFVRAAPRTDAFCGPVIAHRMS